MTRAVATLIGPARTGNAIQLARPDSGFGGGGGWTWGFATLIGNRHRQRPGGVCEDAVGVRLLESGPSGDASAIHIALADGVSGGACGRVAAQAYVKHCVSWDPLSRHNLRDWLAVQADQQVQAALRRHTQEPGASTGAAAWVDGQGCARVNRIGDCRAYLWSVAPDRTILLQQTMADQTMAYMGYVEAGSERADQPSHMVGNGNTGEPEFVTLQMPPAGGLLLCSDGFHEAIQKPALVSHLRTLIDMLRQHGAAYLAHWCDCLVRQAQEEGTDDDVSVVVLGKLA
jgi:serine/threonine protein phosphatase PrpC